LGVPAKEPPRNRIERLRREVRVVGCACRDPRVPWYAKALAGAVVAYALSPIDLIPDFIPVLGYLDDVILIPLGVALVLRMIPSQVLADCRARAQATPLPRGRWIAAAAIVAGWIAATLVLWRWCFTQ
jgi:uncharacterized membrane protein YkvA (DUF1232 family)